MRESSLAPLCLDRALLVNPARPWADIIREIAHDTCRWYVNLFSHPLTKAASCRLNPQGRSVGYAADPADAVGIGNTVQANSITVMLDESLHVNPLYTGLALTAFTAVVILGGIRSIARVCGFLVPFMAGFYVLGRAALLIKNAATLPATVRLILDSAFTGHAVVGGFAGATFKEAMRFGISRGLFSNESGLGSAPIVAAAAQTKDPVRQALVSSSGTFWDTVVICLMTGLVIVNSHAWHEGLTGARLTHAAFEELRMIGPRSILPYRLLWVLAVFFGSTVVLIGSKASVQLVWTFSDIANALMAVPNLVSLILLSGVLVAETRLHLWSPRHTGEIAPHVPSASQDE